MSLSRKTINILGITGSIGQAARDVILANPDLFDVNVLSAHRSEEGLKQVAQALEANHAVLTSRDDLMAALHKPVDITLCAIVGMAGLESMLRAIEVSDVVLIANKEPLVAAGELVMAAARKHNTRILPVDSEHNAIFQVFDEQRRSAVERIIITASGGPFRTWSLEEMAKATPAQATAHPNWSMGQKISVDSATMMNKALEVIEAHHLFNLSPERIDVLIHPQSVVHSMVEYTDGSVLAQMGASDMRTPLANVMNWPERLSTPGQRLDLTSMKRLDFEEADHAQFPALAMAYHCIEKGAAACIALNAANEIAVNSFLAGHIEFLDIIECAAYMIDDTILGAVPVEPLDGLDGILAFDSAVRALTQDYINEQQRNRMVS